MTLFTENFAITRFGRFSPKIAAHVSIAGLTSGSITQTLTSTGTAKAGVGVNLDGAVGNGASDFVMQLSIYPTQPVGTV